MANKPGRPRKIRTDEQILRDKADVALSMAEERNASALEIFTRDEILNPFSLSPEMAEYCNLRINCGIEQTDAYEQCYACQGRSKTWIKSAAKALESRPNVAQFMERLRSALTIKSLAQNPSLDIGLSPGSAATLVNNTLTRIILNADGKSSIKDIQNAMTSLGSMRGINLFERSTGLQVSTNILNGLQIDTSSSSSSAKEMLELKLKTMIEGRKESLSIKPSQPVIDCKPIIDAEIIDIQATP